MAQCDRTTVCVLDRGHRGWCERPGGVRVVTTSDVEHSQSVCPLRDVEVRAITYRYGLRRRRFAGHLEYRLLATRGHSYGTFWLEYAKRDGLSGHHPLCKARSKEALMGKLRAEAATLGNVTSFVEVNHA